MSDLEEVPEGFPEHSNQEGDSEDSGSNQEEEEEEEGQA